MKRFKKGTSNRTVVETLVGSSPEDSEPEYKVLNKSSSDELRYTLGPVYMPGIHDAHGEYTDAEDLRKAVWEFNLSDSGRKLRKQHGQEEIGDIISVFQWPMEVETEVHRPDGKMEKVKFPADTVYAEVRWSEEAWPMVKAGKIGGFSIGGRAVRVKDD